MEHLLLKLVQMLIASFLALMLLDKTKLMPIINSDIAPYKLVVELVLELYCNFLTTSDTVTITATGGGGSSYTDSDVDTHLNVEWCFFGSNSDWNGTDYAWVADLQHWWRWWIWSQSREQLPMQHGIYC